MYALIASDEHAPGMGWVFPVRRGRILDCQYVDASTDATCSNEATRVTYTWDKPYGIEYEADGVALEPDAEEFLTVISCDEHDPNPTRSQLFGDWFDTAEPQRPPSFPSHPRVAGGGSGPTSLGYVRSQRVAGGDAPIPR